MGFQSDLGKFITFAVLLSLFLLIAESVGTLFALVRRVLQAIYLIMCRQTVHL